MPRLSVWMIRAALLHLGVGFLFGALLLIHKGAPITAALWGLRPLHIETMLIGWVVQLAMGVAYWIMPRFQGTRRGNVALAWAAFVLINAGVLAYCFGTWFGWAMLAQAGRSAEVLAALSFGLHAWPRIKPPGA